MAASSEKNATPEHNLAARAIVRVAVAEIAPD
jgi:hypothetical protein